MEESCQHASFFLSHAHLWLLLYNFSEARVFKTLQAERLSLPVQPISSGKKLTFYFLFHHVRNLRNHSKITLFISNRPSCNAYPGTQIENYFSLLSRKSSITLQTMSRLFSCLPSARPVEDDGREQFL